MAYLNRTGLFLLLFFATQSCSYQYNGDALLSKNNNSTPAGDSIISFQQTDTSLYNVKMKQLANGDKSGRWPPKTVSPAEGAVLPFKRIVAYYGNFYSAQMGVLGQYPPEQMLEKLNTEIKEWEKADTLTPVVPAIHYIAVTAQRNPGIDGKYRLRMPHTQIDKAIELASQVNGIVFLDIQVGLSTLQQEIPVLKKYLLMPQVHLGIDPEYAMKNGQPPGSNIGTFDAADINYAAEYLAVLVNENNLPPKILVVHRFTNAMLTNYKLIKTRKEVQFVINMDGFGFPAKKKNTYYRSIYKEPVQFAGFKLFYSSDTKQVKQLMTPPEILRLKPQPIYIQYQ